MGAGLVEQVTLKRWQLKFQIGENYEYKELDAVNRQHVVEMTVDNCDRATYRCIVLNQEEFEEGSAQATLEVTASRTPFPP